MQKLFTLEDKRKGLDLVGLEVRTKGVPCIYPRERK